MQQIIYQEFPENRKFGIELEVSNNLTKQQIGSIINDFEDFYGLNKRAVKVTPGVEGWAQTANNHYWHVKFDRTCGPLGKKFDNGWEIASFIGHGHKDVLHISRLARFLKNAGAEVNLNCGLHIHVEVKDFDETKMGILLARWLKVENMVLSACHISRKNNEYCKLIRSKLDKNNSWYDKSNPKKIWSRLCPRDLTIHNNYEKRVSLNTIGFAISRINKNFSRNTVELRMPECILDETHVKNWTRLIINFIERSFSHEDLPEDLKPVKNIKEALVFLGLAEEDKFSILCPETLNTKIWFLRKILQNSQCEKTTKQAKKYLDFITLV